MKKLVAFALACVLFAAVPAFARTGVLLVAFVTTMDTDCPAIDAIQPD